MRYLTYLVMALVMLSCSTEKTEELITANMKANLEQGKPVNAIYLDENLTFIKSDKNPSVVKFPVGIEPTQNMMIWTKNSDGSFTPKYQIPANGNDGFPLVYNKGNNGIYLNQGDICILEFKWNNRFTGEFTIPAKGK